jgi:hypothetical protein
MKNRKTQARTEAQKQQYLEFIRTSVLKFYKCEYKVFKTLPETELFYRALKVQPVTKKAICKAFDLNIDSMCRRKRQLEIDGKLQQSRKKAICDYTGERAHLLTTNTFLFNSKYFGYE